ncbi:MAG: hypothetical protein SGPRY_011999 [Prymnesium sp.]
MEYAQMAQTPSELNKMMCDDALSERVDAFLRGLEDYDPPELPPIAPFITAEVMLRIHNLVARARL